MQAHIYIFIHSTVKRIADHIKGSHGSFIYLFLQFHLNLSHLLFVTFLKFFITLILSLLLYYQITNFIILYSMSVIVLKYSFQLNFSFSFFFCLTSLMDKPALKCSEFEGAIDAISKRGTRLICSCFIQYVCFSCYMQDTCISYIRHSSSPAIHRVCHACCANVATQPYFLVLVKITAGRWRHKH